MKKNKLGAHLLLTALCLIWLTPFVLLVLQSFRGESGGQVAYILPREWTLDNYAFLLQPESGFFTKPIDLIHQNEKAQAE